VKDRPTTDRHTDRQAGQKDRLKGRPGRCQIPAAIPFNKSICTLCLKLDDKFHFFLKSSLYKGLRKKNIKIYLKSTHMTIFFELHVMTSEFLTVIKN